MGYKWCPFINMFCSEIEEEEIEMAQSVYQGCDGDCRNCEEVEVVN